MRGRKVRNCSHCTTEQHLHACRQLHRDKEVIFAGYKFPHPLDYHILIKVQTKGKKSPREAMDDALGDLCDEFQDISTKFQASGACPSPVLVSTQQLPLGQERTAALEGSC